MLFQYLLLLLLLVLVIGLSIRSRKLTPLAAVTGGVLALGIFLGAGFTGIAMLGAFFMMGTAATIWKLQNKVAAGIAEKKGGMRNWKQVVANGGVAAMVGVATLIFTNHTLVLQLIMAGSLAAATADTLSSELGNIYGSRYYNILTFKKDKRGLDGVVSLEGTLAGVAGSLVIALIAVIGLSCSITEVVIIVIAGTIGNLADSVMGATLERKQYLGNNAVNFLNTAVGAVATGLLLLI